MKYSLRLLNKYSPITISNKYYYYLEFYFLRGFIRTNYFHDIPNDNFICETREVEVACQLIKSLTSILNLLVTK